MNNNPEFELDLDLQMLPAWARQPETSNRYAQYEGEESRERRRGDRPFRRERPPGGGEYRGRREGREGFRGRSNRERREEPRREEPRPPEAPPPEVIVNLVPERKGIELLARQIKLTGRAYPLFQVAALILHKPDRFEVQFATKKGVDGNVLQPLFVCGLDDTLWLSEEEVAQHVLRQHFDTFYQTEKVPTDPPKGTYTLVAQCGLSGTLLGPPNYHDYQNKLRRLHAERFSRMPFDAYKAKVKFVRDEAVVKQWLEEQGFKAEYVGLNLPEPLRFLSREEAEKHFREVHLPNLLKSVEGFSVLNPEGQRFMSRGLRTLLRQTVEEQRRFPLKVATVLSQQLAGHGLHFFKVNKTVTHVCVARPHYLDLKTTVVSDGVRRIVEFIEATPNCTRRKLVDALAPTPPVQAPPPPPQAPAGDSAPPSASGVEAGAARPAPSGPAPTPEQTAVISDLHWLIHQGHVIEFTDGRMETAKAPKPKPPPPPPKAPIPAPSPAARHVSPEARPSPPTSTPPEPPGPAAPAASVAEVPVPEPSGVPATTDPEAPPAEAVSSLESRGDPPGPTPEPLPATASAATEAVAPPAAEPPLPPAAPAAPQPPAEEEPKP